LKPFCDDFRFRDQIRSAGGSIMDNIAEGFGRGGNREFGNFLSIAKISNDEVRSQAYRALDFNYISAEVFYDLLERTENIQKNQQFYRISE
jgi:four helix bundle protein